MDKLIVTPINRRLILSAMFNITLLLICVKQKKLC